MSDELVEQFLDSLALMMTDEVEWARFIRMLEERRKKLKKAGV